MSEKTRGIRVALDCLGCKLNQAEMEHLSRQLTESGYQLVSPGDGADIYVLNTCTVTHVADRKSRHMLRQAHSRNPDARLIATGCYAQRAPEELGRIRGVEVADNEAKEHLLRLLKEGGYPAKVVPTPGNAATHTTTRNRSFIKIQDGCNNFCAYCIVPLVRGREKSRGAEEILAEIKERAGSGYREVVLTGTEIGSYRADGLNLAGLIERILSDTDIARLRLSSLKPREITPGFIRLWSDERLCRHFHLSLQSGSDGVLKRMKRDYTTADYKEAVSLIRGTAPEAAITTDIIVGFPAETDEEFEENFNFCRQMNFARIHVFAFSPRPGTQAAGMSDPVKATVKRERSQRMLALAREGARRFARSFVGEHMMVLWEKKSGGTWSGHTDNYLKVYTESNDDLNNQFRPVRLEEIRGDGVWGNLEGG